TGVDGGALSGWTVVGLRLFSGGSLPDIRAFTKAARWVLLFAATERFDGNISRMAAALGTSRRAIREQLKGAGLYARRTSSTDVEPR
ncbi:MAG: helix-turn-helix domain-containing protein, partial [Nannocystaceae bacterium]